MHRGSCLCGDVAFAVDAPLKNPIACHCKQCRQQSGHYFSAVAAPKEAVTFTRRGGLKWYRASDIATRGFCQTCGATLFWRSDTSANIMVAMASLDDPEGLRLSGHFWVDFKGDYYDIKDGLPQHKGDEG